MIIFTVKITTELACALRWCLCNSSGYSEPVIQVSLRIPCVYLNKLIRLFNLFRQVTLCGNSSTFFAFISLFLRRQSHVTAVSAEPNAEALANLMEAQPQGQVKQVQQQGQQPQVPLQQPQASAGTAAAAEQPQVPLQQPQAPANTTAAAQQPQVGEVFCSSFLFSFSLLCAVVVGVFVFAFCFSLFAFFSLFHASPYNLGLSRALHFFRFSVAVCFRSTRS